MRVNTLALVSSFSGALLGLLGAGAIPVVYGQGSKESVPALLWILLGIVAFSILKVLASYLAGRDEFMNRRELV